MFTIYGIPISSCTHRVIVCLIEMGLTSERDFKLVPIPLDGRKTPEYMAHQPFGQVPYLKDEEAGMEMWESRAIVKYIAKKINSPLGPPDFATDPIGYAKFEQGHSIESQSFDGFASNIYNERVVRPLFGRPTDKIKLAENIKAGQNKLEGYERMLAKQAYIGGDKLSVVDLFHLPFGAPAINLGPIPSATDGSLPNVARWWKEIEGLESWGRAKEWLASKKGFW